MAKLTNSGVRYIVGVLSIAVSAVVVGSIIASAMYTLADAIREGNAVPSQVSSSSSASTVSSSSSSSSISSSSSEVIPLQEFTVEFNTMGGTPATIASMEVTENNTIPSFPSVTLAGHTFAGWFTGNTPSDVLFTALMPVTRDMVLYARFNANPDPVTPPPGAVTHVVAFDAAGGTPVTSIQVEDGKTFRLPSTTREGYIFLGWFTGNLPGDVLFTANTVVLRDTSLVARWERQSFMITFLTYGGSTVEPMVAQADSDIEAPTSPTKMNASFEGWYLDAAFTEPFTFTTMPEESFTLHALWGDVASDGLIYAFTGTSYVVTGYDGIHNIVMIPTEVDGFPVTEITNFAFEGNSTLVSVVMPEGSEIESIGRGAFMDMPNLREVILSETLTSIADDAFRNAVSLRELNIPFDVTSLGRNILTGAESLRKVTIHQNNNIENNAFGVSNFKYLFGGTIFSDNVTVPSTLRTIELTEGSTGLPNDFFRSLPMITEVIIPDSVTTVGTNVLTGATNLRNLRWTFTSNTAGTGNAFLSYAFGATYGAITNVPSTLQEVIINETTSTRILSYAFYNIASITSVELPENITEIQEFSFAHAAVNTSRLQYIDLPSNLRTLGNSAFSNNTSLLELDIPDSVITLGTNVLTATNALASVSFNYSSLPGLDTAKFFRYFYGATTYANGNVIPTALKTVEVRGSNTTLSNDFFRAAITIETVTIPQTITTIGNHAFQGMTQLKQVQVTGQEVVANKVLLPTGLTSLGTNVFQSSTSIVEVVIPQGITVIPVDTFADATSLRLITLSSATTSIGNNAFLRTAIEVITLPQTLTTLGNFAFSQTRLAALTIPTSVTTIGTNLILNTPQLVTINFSVDSLQTGTKFFRYFYGGAAFNSGGTLPTTPSSALTTVNVTGGTALPENFFNMGAAFPILKTITLANTFTSIGASAFLNLTGITALNLSEGILSIGASALQNTTLLASFVLPRSVTTIGASAFQASGITNLVLGPNLTSIGNLAFNSMPSILLIEFLNSVPPTMGTFVFNTAPSGNLFPATLTVQIPFGSTTAYTTVVTTPTNNNYAQFVALQTATRLVEAENPNPEPPAGE